MLRNRTDRSDTLRPDTLRPDTLRPDTLRPDTSCRAVKLSIDAMIHTIKDGVAML